MDSLTQFGVTMLEGGVKTPLFYRRPGWTTRSGGHQRNPLLAQFEEPLIGQSLT